MVCVVIPVHNRKAYTYDCIESLRNQTLRADEIIVVDDGSTDGTDEMLQKEFPQVRVLSGSGKLFWTASINMGIRHALELGAHAVITMNNDTVASPTFVEKMMEGSRQRPDSLIGALDVDAITRQSYYGGEIINWKWSTSTHLLKVLSPRNQSGLHEVSLFPARGLLIPRKVFETIGLFEENKLPHYLADYDFTHQARKHGFSVFCNYDAVLYTYPEEGGDHKIRTQKTFRNYMKHLFDIKGGGNLKNFTIYTFRNCPPQYILLSLLTGYVRRLTGFWLR